jgi:hypothetical protein
VYCQQAGIIVQPPRINVDRGLTSTLKFKENFIYHGT